MNPDEAFSNYFDVYELLSYVYAKKHRHLLEMEYKELEEGLYDDIPMVTVRYDYDLGRVYFGSGGSLEDFVLNMIEKKDAYFKALERIRAQGELFDLAMTSLTPRERDVIQVHYFNRKNDLGLSLEFFNDILQEAQTKLCSVIGKERQKQREAEEQQRKEKIKQDVDKWKRGRVVS